MAYKGKGKEVAGSDPAAGVASSSSPFAKRKKAVVSGPSGAGRRAKRRRPGVLQFFDDAALDDDGEDGFSSDEDGEGLDFEYEKTDLNSRVDVKTENKGPTESGKTSRIPFFIKEEELSGDELEELIRNRYGNGSEFVKDEDYKENEDKIETKDAMIWRVKCTVGSERQLAFCFMQKYADLDNFGTKLALISVFALDHVKGYIFVEADKPSDVNEACKGFCNVYPSRVNLVPNSEVPQLFSSRSKSFEVSVGAWVRMKGGNYKGDLGKVVAIDDGRRRATVKLVPRVDLSAIAKKFGGGVSLKLAPVPAPRLISSYELEKFGPHIEVKRDRQTGEEFEILDGMMLKDGYLYKRVSFGSLIYSSVEPSKDELLKFSNTSKDKDDDLNWVSSVYDDHKEKQFSEVSDKASSSIKSAYDIHDLVLFGKKDFGVVIAEEKDYFKILKGGIEGVEVVAVRSKDIKNSCVDKMFTAADRYKKTVVINDAIKVLEGPLQGRQGIVKHMYKGSLFIRDDNEMENGGFFCVKSNSCGKIMDSKGFVQEDLGNDKSSLAPDRSSEQQNSVYVSSSSQNYEQTFHVGQTLRIRKGPLKGYLCRVVKIFRSDITVKLDSLVKMITVQEKFLSDLNTKRDHSTAMSSDGLGSEGSLFIGNLSVGETGNQADKASWDIGVQPLDSDSWQPFSSNKNNEEQTGHGDDPWGGDTTAAGGSGTMKDSWGASTSVAEKGKEDDPWGTKMTPGDRHCEEGSDNAAGNWGCEVSNSKSEADPWGSKACNSSVKSIDGWDKTADAVPAQRHQVDSWDGIASSFGPNVVGSKDLDGWGKTETSVTGWKTSISDMKKGNEGSHDQDNEWKAASSINEGKNSWTHPEISHNDRSCSWDSKGKETINTEGDAWATASDSQQDRRNAGQDAIDTSLNRGGNSRSHSEWGESKHLSSTQEPNWNKRDDAKTAAADPNSWSKPRTVETQEQKPGSSWGNESIWDKRPSGNGDSHLDGSGSGCISKKSSDSNQPSSWDRETSLPCKEADKKPSGDQQHDDNTGSWGRSTVSDKNENDTWDKPKSSGGDTINWNKTGVAEQNDNGNGAWGQVTPPVKNENDNWGKPKSSGGDRVNWNKTGCANDNDAGAWGQITPPTKNENDNWGKPKSFGGDTIDWNKTDDTGSWGLSAHSDKNANDNWEKPKSSGGAAVSWNKTGGSEKNDNDNGAWGQVTHTDKNENDNWGKPKSSGSDTVGWNKEDGAEANRNSWEGGSSSNGSGQRSNWDGGRNFEAGVAQTSNWSKQKDFNGSNDSSSHRGRGGRFGSRGGRNGDFSRSGDQEGGWSSGGRGWHHDGGNNSNSHRGVRFGSRGGRNGDFSRSGDEEGNWSSGGRGWHSDGGNFNGSKDSNFHRGRGGRFGSRGGRNDDFSRSGDHEGNWPSGGRGWHHDGGSSRSTAHGSSGDWSRGRGRGRGGYNSYDKKENRENYGDGSFRKNADSCWGNDQNTDWTTSAGNNEQGGWGKEKSLNSAGWGNDTSDSKGGMSSSKSTGGVFNQDAAGGNSWGNSSSDWNSNNEGNNWSKTKSSGGGNQYSSWEKGSQDGAKTTTNTPHDSKDSPGACDQGSSWDKASSSWGKNQEGAGGSGGW